MKFDTADQFVLFTLFLVFLIKITVACEIDVQQHPNWMLLDHKKCGSSTADRIIGGKNASMGAYPWIARIGYSGVSGLRKGELSYRCGGTLINRFYVITAAHCVKNLPGGIKVSGVRLGEHNTETNPDCEDEYCAEPVQDFEPASIIVHEDYDEPLFRNDIALIRLKGPAIYSEFVMPVCMVQDELLEKDFVGETVEVAGWGIYDIDDPKESVLLQTVKLPVVETERCKKAFKSYTAVSDQQTCVGGIVGQDSCGGDSGGPLMKVASLNGRPKYYLIGIVSFGARYCGASTMPAVYTRLSSYITWILDNMSP